VEKGGEWDEMASVEKRPEENLTLLNFKKNRPADDCSRSRRKVNTLEDFFAIPSLNSNYRVLFQRIQRRNGEIVDFNKEKITEAVWKAARSVGGTDRRTADLMADKVVLYLARSYDDHLLTIEEVQDAVEKVLIENGHAKTAKAYILYREQRARVRRFREGKRSMGLPDALETEPDQDIEVLTSGGQLVRWNRERIVQALIRETGLAPSVADRISREVERQIIYSKASRLTASLIRELVNVKLLEYGYTQESQLHSRLGVPFFDIERIIMGQEEQAGQKPAGLERNLSGAMMEQYTLSRVFSSEVSEAHLRGDLSLYGLSEPWRMEECFLPLEYLKKTGLGAPDFSHRWPPAESAEELAVQLGRFNSVLSRYVTRSIFWDGFNLFLAPLVHEMPDEQLRSVVRLFLRQFASDTHFGPKVTLGFYPEFPKTLWNTAALGAGAEHTGKTYAYYAETARRLFWFFLEEFAGGGVDGQPYGHPVFGVHLSRDFLDKKENAGSRERLQQLLPRLVRWTTWVHGRQPASVDYPLHFICSGEKAERLTEYKYPWKLRASFRPAVSINLPSLALRADGDPDELISLAEQQVHLAYTAFRQREQFLDQLTGQQQHPGEFAFLHPVDGEPVFRPQRTISRILLWGLRPMVEWHTGMNWEEHEECRKFAVEFVKRVSRTERLCRQSSRIPCMLGLEDDPDVGRRFQKMIESEVRLFSKKDRLFRVSLSEEERVLLFHKAGIATESSCALPMESAGEAMSGDSLLSSLEKLCHQGWEGRIKAFRSLWACRDCCRTAVGQPDICPHCGSLELVRQV
jgi:ribonucleoside-triphosphate reductase (formate)